MSMLLPVHVIPNASRTEIVGWQEGALRVRLAAPPLDGKANQELCRFFGKFFGCASSLVEVERGLTHKKKRIRLPLAETDAQELIEQDLKKRAS